MAAYTVNFKRVRKNVDWYTVWRFTTDGTTPLDLTGADFHMDVRPRIGEPPVLELNLEAAIPDPQDAFAGLVFATDGSDGELILLVDHTVMADVAVGSYRYDLVIIRNGISEVLAEGSIRVVEGVTEL
jgi:hypothetical protein